MASYNRILLLGNLTRDPQLSYTPNQTAVVDFGVATNRRWTGADGAQREEVCFVDCRAFGRTAENINKYLQKGAAVFVEGRLTFDSWTTQDGSKRSKHRVTVDTVQFLRTGDRQKDAMADCRPTEGGYEPPPGPRQPNVPYDDSIPF
jgi:single-strand DNA-binding protein